MVDIISLCTCIHVNACRLCHLIMTLPCANEPPFFKVGELAQLVKALVAYWLGALPKVAGSNPGGSMYNYFHT